MLAFKFNSRCLLTVSEPALKAPTVSTLEATVSNFGLNFTLCRYSSVVKELPNFEARPLVGRCRLTSEAYTRPCSTQHEHFLWYIWVVSVT